MKVTFRDLKDALLRIGYSNKLLIFLNRVAVEADYPHDDIFLDDEVEVEAVKSVAWSMLDRDYEKELMKALRVR